jgi:hypothetical protein
LGTKIEPEISKYEAGVLTRICDFQREDSNLHAEQLKTSSVTTTHRKHYNISPLHIAISTQMKAKVLDFNQVSIRADENDFIKY